MAAISQEKDEFSGVPPAHFIEDVAEFLGARKPQEALTEITEQYQKYQYMEASLQTRKSRVAKKIPELKQSIVAIEKLQKIKEPTDVQFELADDVFAEATIPVTEKPLKVNLWLGANVMLEYELDEALELLKNQLGQAETTAEKLSKSLQFITNQITIMQVSRARVINYEIGLRQKEKSQ